MSEGASRELQSYCTGMEKSFSSQMLFFMYLYSSKNPDSKIFTLLLIYHLALHNDFCPQIKKPDHRGISSDSFDGIAKPTTTTNLLIVVLSYIISITKLSPSRYIKFLQFTIYNITTFVPRTKYSFRSLFVLKIY